MGALAAVAAGGALGAPLRVALSKALPGPTPAATLLENAVGAFVLGAVILMLHRRPRGGGRLYAFACTGLLGSFTTFSNFTVEIVELTAESYALAIGYLLASLAAGLAAALAGMSFARWLIRRASREPAEEPSSTGRGGEP